MASCQNLQFNLIIAFVGNAPKKFLEVLPQIGGRGRHIYLGEALHNQLQIMYVKCVRIIHNCTGSNSFFVIIKLLCEETKHNKLFIIFIFNIYIFHFSC